MQEERSNSQPISQSLFIRHMKDALANLYDPVHLQTHPLIDLLGIAPEPGETQGTSLRRLLRQVIESLRPPHSISQERPEWLSYRVLWMRYIQSQGQVEISLDLGISQATYYRKLQEALEALASALRPRYELALSAGIVQPSDDGGASSQRARDEAMRLALDAQRQLVDLRQVMEGVLQTVLPLTRQKGVTLTFDAWGVPSTTAGDPAILRQIILNVLAEAIEVTTSSHLRVELATDGTARTWTLADLQIPDNMATDLFGRKGFSVSEGLLQVYGGTLQHTQCNDGSHTIRVELPTVRPKHILIIDDDQDTIRLYRRYLQSEEYVVSVATCGSELWPLGAKPDLVFLDVLMPFEDGWEILQQLRVAPETADIPVIICSVLSQPNLALSLGAAAVLQKPIGRETLVGTVRAILAGEDSPG